MRFLLLGGDGYIGWPLAIELALRYPDAPVVLVDNLDRRRLVREVGGNSVTVIAEPEARLRAFREVFGQDNLSFFRMDVTDPAVSELVAKVRPTHVYHLAQQASAPFSMSDVERACYTVHNNEIGNLRVLWAVRAHVPDAHLIKLGTFGEYAKCGIDIPEGYFRPVYKGVEATRPVPFPRESDDIYHITKINDTNFVSLACRKWGLRITDVMQSTIFGVYTADTYTHPELYTRFDYDAVFGTVLNRFITQAVLNHPLTVYGSGFQRTGLMALPDALTSLAAMAERHPEPGEHRVINHVTEDAFCINELAERVVEIATDHGHAVTIERAHDPRREQDTAKAAYGIEAAYVADHVKASPLDEVLRHVFEIVDRHRDRVRGEVFAPRVTW